MKKTKLCAARWILLPLCCLVFITHGQAQTKPVKKKPIPVKKALAKKKPDTARKVVPIAKAETRIRITTDMGEIIVRLYDKTPQHRDNFVKLVKERFYDSLLFHRVIAGFMIQGGDPQSKTAQPGTMLGMGDMPYMVPAEFDSTLYHKKGALAAARNNNPEKASSGCQFYLVHGRKYTDNELTMIENSNHVYFNPTKRMTYKMLGGTPTLDMNYTVFGEVVSGLDVIDQIANQPRDASNRPITDVHMRMEVLDETAGQNGK